MASAATAMEPNLPWADQREDRLFRLIAIVLLLLFLATGAALNLVTLPEVVQKNLVDVSPRLAKLILEKQKVKPPPKKELVKKEVEKKEVEKKEEPKKKEKPKKKESAREVAKKSGLIALSDELEDLREAFDLDASLGLPQQNDGSQEVKIAASGDLLTSGAQQSSGGIQTDTLNRNLATSELAQRQTTDVESNIQPAGEKLAKASSTQKTQSQSQQAAGGKRSADEIERVFQKNKGGIFNIYNRALRKNPALSGQVVVELTIAPSGEVTRVRILSSELGDEALERKLVRTGLDVFPVVAPERQVAEITVTYPIEFLPS